MMLTELKYEDWVSHCFDHQVSDPAWHFSVDAPYWKGSAELTIEHLTRLFTTSVKSLTHFSDAQLNQGFWYLVSNSCSDHMYALVDTTVSEEKRIHCMGSMALLFSDFFASRCTNVISADELEKSDVSPLNSICYMWWDVIPIHGVPKDPARRAVDDTAMTVMERLLQLSALPCQESALHGLGHWHCYYPERVEAVIERYLTAKPRDARLVSYAKSAACGCVQ